MKAKKLNERPKAFIGALISVGASVAGNLIGKSQQKKAQKQQEELAQKQAEFSAAQQQAPILSEVLNNNRKNFSTIGDELIMRNGGNIPRKGVVPLVAEGGTAIPIKKDSFLLKGRKHNNGGIVIGKGKNSIEAEGDEVVQITPKQLKVFSAQPILNGNSPAELVQKGAKPSKVFDAQERFKDRNNLNDDGTKKKRNMRTITGKKKLGGLSRKESYGSDNKPYPSVKSKDFAGSGRSYPIPTKADARDALRLAGLHGRSDVRAKVYKKYPELKNKKAVLGTLGSLTGANRRLLALNQNVPSAGITAGAKITNPSASNIKPMNLSSGSSSSGGSKFSNFMSGAGGEAVSAGIGAAGSLISGLLNKGSIDKVSAPQVPAPQLVTPAKLKTNININPELSENRENELRTNRLIRGNTGSSAAALARIQSNSYRSLSERNKLRSHKENVETQLYNQDAINRQQVASANAQQVNEANRFNSISATQTTNDKIQATVNNRTQMIEGITSGIRDYQTGMDKRRADENATAAIMSANPENVPLFMKLMQNNKNLLGNMRKGLFRCGGKKKIS
jgi:hypothetical protein